MWAAGLCTWAAALFRKCLCVRGLSPFYEIRPSMNDKKLMIADDEIAEAVREAGRAVQADAKKNKTTGRLTRVLNALRRSIGRPRPSA